MLSQNGLPSNVTSDADGLAGGIVSALKYEWLSNTFFSLGSGEEFSSRDIIEALSPLMQEISGEARAESLSELASSVRSNVLDFTKLQGQKSWKPIIEFSKGMHCTREWLRNSCG